MMEADNMERSSFVGRKQIEIYLNTKGCCFFCLKVTQENDENSPQESLQYLCRHLNVVESSKKLVFVNSLSDSCVEVNKQFTQLFHCLEKIQMEIDSLVEGINKKMSNAYYNPELVKKYSQKMTSDKESLAQLVVVDKIRKKIASKSSKVRNHPHQLKVHLQKLSDPVFKRQEKKLLNYQNCHRNVKQSTLITSTAANNDYTEQETSPCNSPSPSPPSPSSSLSPRLSMVKKARRKKRQQVTGGAVLGQNFTHNRNTGKFECATDTCQREFLTRETARIHCNSVHLGKGLVCEICGAEFGKRFNLERHFRRAHSSLSEKKTSSSSSSTTPSRPRRRNKNNYSRPSNYNIFNPETGIYSCRLCSKEFTHYSSCWSHYIAIHEGKRYKCEICNVAEFKYPSTLREHRQSCNDETLEKRLMRIKRRKLDPRLKFPCKFCRKKFINAQVASQHEKCVHLKEYNYPCDLCVKRYKTSTALRDHKNTFHFGKRFTCGTCKKQFATNGSLTWHQKLKRCFKKSTKKSNIKIEQGSKVSNLVDDQISSEPILLGVSFVKIEQHQHKL